MRPFWADLFKRASIVSVMAWVGAASAFADPVDKKDVKFFPEGTKLKSKSDLDFGLDFLLKDTKFKNFKNVEIKDDNGSFIKSFDTDFKGKLKKKNKDAKPFSLKGSVKKRFTPKSAKGKFDVKLREVDLKGKFPKGDMVLLSLSPLAPSIGRATLREIQGAPVLVDSFFDVFFEIDVNGRMAPQVNGPASFQSVLVPEPAGLTLMLVGAGGLGLALRRRRTSARN